MSFGLMAAALAYMMTSAAAFLVLRRMDRPTLRVLAWAVALMPMFQVVRLVGSQSAPVDHFREISELFIAAVCLSLIYLLKKETRERKTVELRVRLLEAAVPALPAASRS